MGDRPEAPARAVNILCILINVERLVQRNKQIDPRSTKEMAWSMRAAVIQRRELI